MKSVQQFLFDEGLPHTKFNAVSLFSGAGLSDYGYRKAGFNFVVQAEMNSYRAAIGQDNFPDSHWVIGDVRKKSKDVVAQYKKLTNERLDLLVATPPCQGMSSSNPSRGKRQSDEAKKNEEKNALILSIVPVVKALQPRIIVAENVRQILTQTIMTGATTHLIIDVLKRRLKTYRFFTGVVDVADYGLPQHRRRAVIVGVHNDEEWLNNLEDSARLPWPKPTCGLNGEPHFPLRAWFKNMQYEKLDAKSEKTSGGNHPLHYVPTYEGDRYLQVASIPKHSGKSAYDNSTCPECSFDPVPVGLVRCPRCAGLMKNRPYVFVKRKPRLIAGFHSSYRRMDSNRPAPTITTNSSHVGSDFKIHPYENRVLSILECSDLQTIPRSYKWDRAIRDEKSYTIRVVVGEAFPTYFTYLHGSLLADLLAKSAQSSVAKTVLSRCRGE